MYGQKNVHCFKFEKKIKKEKFFGGKLSVL